MTRPLDLRLKIKPDRFAALAAALAPVVYFLPAILGGAVLCPDDGTIFNTPLRVAAAHITLDGHLPLWNPYIFGGMPLFASAQGGLLFPPNWFYLIFDTPAATNLMVVSTYVIAALGVYLFARRSGSSRAGSVVTSLAWQWGGFLVGQIGHINIVQTGAMLPWLLWAVDGYGKGRGRKWGVALSAFVALQAFVGHQQTFAYSLLLVAAYAIVTAFTELEKRVRYLWSLAFVGAGVMLASVQILPTFELLRNSLRSEATYDFFTSFSMPRRMIETFLAPYIFGGGDGSLFRAPYIGQPFYGELAGYVGVLGVLLALVAVLLKRDARTKFWAAVAIACLFLALGSNAPFHFYKLIYHVPILNLFRVPARHLLEAEFALAVLAGRGLTALADARGNRRALRRVAAVCALVIVSTCLVVTWGRPAGFHLGREAPVGFLRAPELFFPVVVACASAWALLRYARGRRGATLILIAVLAVDLAVWGQSSGWRVSSPSSDEEFFREPETVAFLRGLGKDAASYRILTAPHSFDPAVAPVPPSVSHSTDWVLWTQPDVYMMSGLQNAAGYDGFGLARYSRLAGEMKVWGELTDPDATLRGPSRELDVLNVRYLLSMRVKSGAATQVAPAFLPVPRELDGLAFAESDLGEPYLGAGRRMTFNVPAVEADRIALLSNLSWSEDVPDGAEVAHVRLRSKDGRIFELSLRAGVDTSEWAYDRAETLAHIKHKRATVATSYKVEDPNGDYEGHAYVTSLALPERATITGGEITVTADARRPKLQLNVSALSLVDAGAGRTYPLRREWLEMNDAADDNRPTESHATNDSRWHLLAQTTYVDIYENARALPRAWLASDARSLGEQATLEVIRTGRLPDGSKWEPRRTALVESEPSVGFGADAAEGSAEVTRYEPNRVDVKTDAASPSILVLSENHYPGWRAYLDGHSVGVMRVDYALRGVAVPAGTHEVRFVYIPKSAIIGLLVSLLVAAALLLWWMRLLPEERVMRVVLRLGALVGQKKETSVREEV